MQEGAAMATTSKPLSRALFIYLQRPDSGEWVTVGRYRSGQTGEGFFLYAPSYAPLSDRDHH